MSSSHPKPKSTRATGRSLRERLTSAWRTIRWPSLATAAVVTFVLGYVGFREYFEAVDVTKSSSDLAYLSLQLFALESGSVPESGAPWTLEVARIAAPVIAGAAVVVAVGVVFREQIAEWRLRRERDHVVVCGLGDAGSMLTARLIESGRRVVAVDVDETNPAVASARHRGAGVVVGDARDRDVLGRANVDRASHLVCLMGAEDTNADVVLQASDLVVGREGPALACLAHIRDPDLCVLMRADELASGHRGGSRIDFFNIDEQGARTLLTDHPPWLVGGPEGEAPAILVVGLNRFGQSLVVELARRWRTDADPGRPKPTLVVVDPDAPGLVDRLRTRYRQLEQAARLVPVLAEVEHFDATVVSGCPRPDITYVCIDDDSVALQAALRLRQSLSEDSRVVVELAHTGALVRLIERPEHGDRLRAFDVMDRTLRPDLLLGGTNEVLARAIHQEYVDEQRRAGGGAADDAALVPWERLPGSLKESNRDQAAHIGTKLAAVGCGIAPLTDWEVHAGVFSEREVEMLAEMEHGRWVEQRKRDGWTSGPKDVAAKRTPYLVPWDDLTGDVKEWDRQAVRGIPMFLARAGYQVVTADG